MQNQSNTESSQKSFLQYINSALSDHLSFIIAMIPVFDGHSRTGLNFTGNNNNLHIHCTVSGYRSFYTKSVTSGEDMQGHI